VRADLPVGQGLQDHWSVPQFYVRRKPGPFHAGMRLDRLSRAMLEGYLLRRGPATRVPVNIFGFLRSGPEEPVPDLEFLLMPTSPGAKPWFPGWRAPYKDAIGIRPALLHARGRGEVTLRSADPAAVPAIRFNALQDPEDVRRLIKGVRLGRELVHHPALDAYRGAELTPGERLISDAEIESFIRKTATPLYHPAATCAIGRVVDSQLRVLGLDGLRVVDASVMPDLITAHINACVMMIAEKASDLIRGREPTAIAARNDQAPDRRSPIDADPA
jgi:4-pyridoxate dehydrogenase